MARGARETLSWLEHDGSHGLCNALKSAPLLLPSLSFFPENQTCVRVRHEAGQETTTTLETEHVPRKSRLKQSTK